MAYPVILIHGMSCTGANLKRVASLMTQRGYECLAPTLPAHDASPDQPLHVGRQSLRDYLTFLEQIVATREDRRPPIIIGHSMGGLLAQRLAARVQPLALVLLTPAAPSGINGLSLTNIGAVLDWMSNGAFFGARPTSRALRARSATPSAACRPIVTTLCTKAWFTNPDARFSRSACGRSTFRALRRSMPKGLAVRSIS